MKWLLVERATLAGDVIRLERSLQRVTEELAQKRATLGALDTTIRLTDSRLYQRAAGVIHAFAPYGARGSLKKMMEFILASRPEGC